MTRVSTCRFCGRTLPLDQFPVKPGFVRARYKECAECHELGHSCIPKEKPKRTRRKYATDEERLAAKKEYMRQYNAAHREQHRQWYWKKKGQEPPEKTERRKLTDEEKKARRRESQRKWDEKNRDRIRENQRRYYQEHKKQLNARSAVRIKQTRAKSREEQKKPVERFFCTNCNTAKPVDDFITDGRQYKVCNDCRAKHTKRREAGCKPKSPHGTGERCEYHRQYWQRHKEEIKAKRCENVETSKAAVTDRRIVTMFEKGYSPNDIASRCQVTVEHVKLVIKREGCQSGEARMCCDCWLYPCFTGMDVLSSNLALTCQKYHRKENAS